MTHVRISLSAALAVALAAAGPGAATPRLPTPVPPAALTGVLPLLIPAQSCEGECPGRYDGPTRSERDPVTPSGAPTEKFVKFLNGRKAMCADYTDVWRIDCLADGLQQAAKALPQTPDYAKARREMQQAAAELNAIARKNADRSKPPKVRKASNGLSTSRPIIAVAPERVAATNAQADAVIDELATTLLRSAPNPSSQAQLALVASSVDSTKVLLRSS